MSATGPPGWIVLCLQRRSRSSCFLKMDSKATLPQVSTRCPPKTQEQRGSLLRSLQSRARKCITPRTFEGGLQPPRGRNPLFLFTGLPYRHLFRFLFSTVPAPSIGPLNSSYLKLEAFGRYPANANRVLHV
jgi:hypothetical protein